MAINRFALPFAVFFSVLMAGGTASAQVDVDKTCASCSRLKNDSLNLKIRKIRLNQVGYLPQDPNKAAFVADPSVQACNILDAATRQVVFSPGLKDVGTHLEGAMMVKSYYNSITPMDSVHKPAANVHLYRADFSAFKTPGTYLLSCGADTSAHFSLDPKIYNFVFETSLKFFGSNRCGATHSWMHKDCHLKDGDFLGTKYSGALSGGWHDCGDHIKVGETLGYAAAVLAMTYAFYPDKAEDFYGKSYNDTLPFGTDGIPDVLYEAKVGADYILKLYKVSKELGLIDKGDMYHGVIDGEDHAYWDKPENQDLAPKSKGGPPRTPRAGIGSNVAGMYVASLAFFAWGWEPYDPAYARECRLAAMDIYDKIVMARRGSQTMNQQGFYTGGGETTDDEALAALALWYCTKDARFRKDLLEDPARGTNPLSMFNQGIFPTGLLAHDANRPFHPGGWTSDYQNTFVYVLYGLSKLIVGNPETAAAYGLSAAVADSLNKDVLTAMKRLSKENSNGSATYGDIHADEPYHGVFTSVDWGYNRYNMGTVLGLFFYWDLTKDPLYYNIGVDNLNYVMGMNPWDISFIMGAGDKNLQHPHNRAANPEGYNAGGFPYAYQSPKGALMGGCHPKKVLKDEWSDYINTETCIDFSAQLLTSAQMLAADLPPDKQGPSFRNVNIFPEERSALVTWATDEISRDTVFLLDAPGGRLLQTLPADVLARNKQVEIKGLAPNTTYYIYFAGMDVRRNHTVDKNNGEFWKFTTKASAVAAAITKVKVCNETHESAMVTWWTRNGYFSSQVDYGKTTALGLTKSPDDAGIPTMFHQVTLKELEAATPYYFQVQSGTTKDDNAGKFYQFSTSQVLVDYTIRIKPTNKAASGQSAHFYVDVANNESKHYHGLELRFYFTADATTAADLVAKGFDNQRFDVGGMAMSLNITYGSAKQVPGMPDQWYFPITLNDTLHVASRARFEMQINSGGQNGWNNQPFSFFQNAWSIRPHSRPPDPVAFEGVDLAKGSTGAYKGPDLVETVNGKAVIAYTENPYITAYYKGVHVFGYGPDYLTDKLQVRRKATLALTSPAGAAPVSAGVEGLDLRQENGNITLAGKASSNPDGRIDEIVVNGETLSEAAIKRDAEGGAEFTHAVSLVEGTNVFDVIAWDTAHCAFESRKLIVNWRKGPPLPLPQAATPVANPPGRAGRDSIVVALTSATPGADIWYTLDGKTPVPGDMGSTLFSGVIVIRNQATLKAVAVKAGFTQSAEMKEEYDVFPFKVANLRSAALRDRDADGYADQVVLSLDTSLGAPSLAVIAGQLQGAKLTSGLIAGQSGLSGDTLRFELAKNTLRIRDGVEKLTLPPPAALQDGMLRPGDFILKDEIAPVLRRAILRKGVAGAPDSLVVAFSEEIRIQSVGPSPFGAIRSGDSLKYDFVLGAGSKTDLQGLKAGETAYLFPIQSTPAAGNPATVAAPQSGDWLWIHAAAGISDLIGVTQANEANIRVPLQIQVSLDFAVRMVAPDGYSRLGPPDFSQPWAVFGGPGLQGALSGNPALPALSAKPDSARSTGVIIESTLPFSVSMSVLSTLGEFVNRVQVNVTDRDFALLEPGRASGSRRMHLYWNGISRNGSRAGTGAYVYMWNIVFFPVDKPAQATSGKITTGILRSL